MDKLAEALDKAIKDKEDSLRGAGRAMGVATGTVEGWRNGWRKPQYKHVRPLASYVGVDTATVLEWIESSAHMRSYRDWELDLTEQSELVSAA